MHNIAAVIITYEPNDSLILSLNKIQQQVDSVYIVDNGSRNVFNVLFPVLSSNYRDKIILISNDSNLGIGAALNIGCDAAMNDGYEYVVTFDQDSVVSDNFINNLVKTYRQYSQKCRVGLVGANLQLDDTGAFAKQILLKRLIFRGIIPKEDSIVSFLVTSGCLTKLSLWKKLGGFREDFFIDYVDTEFSLRCLKSGYTVIVSSEALLRHQLGNKSTHNLLTKSVAATNHSPLRRYYIARNSVHMLKLYGLKFPAWIVFEFYSFSMTYLKLILFEDKKILKTKMILKGWLHGLIDKFGPYNKN